MYWRRRRDEGGVDNKYVEEEIKGEGERREREIIREGEEDVARVLEGSNRKKIMYLECSVKFIRLKELKEPNLLFSFLSL